MEERNSKTIFTKDEYQRLRELIRQKEAASPSAQKVIRAKIRKIGLRWKELAGSTPYTLSSFENLIASGTLKIIGVSDTDRLPLENNEPAFPVTFPVTTETTATTHSRENSDEAYVISLCDEVLNQKALRQHRFDFLTGDSGSKLPVDAYYPELRLVVEYHERQHTEEVRLFDRRQTVSGVSRGEQRKIYDRRRAEVLPRHGIRLAIISYSDFGTSKRLHRDHDRDIKIVREILKQIL